MSINRTQSILDKLQVAIPVALLNSDGSPLHPPIDHTQNRNIYAISTKDGEDILSMQESSKPLKILEKENLEKITQKNRCGNNRRRRGLRFRNSTQR